MSEAALETKVLQYLSTNERIASTVDYAAQLGIAHDVLVGTIKSLEMSDMVTTTVLASSGYELLEEGAEYVAKGSPELQVFNAIPAEGSISLDALNAQLGAVAKFGVAAAMKGKIIKMEKGADGQQSLSRAASAPLDVTKDMLQQIARGEHESVDKKELANLVKRKLVQAVNRKYFSVSKGSQFALERKKLEVDLTPEMIASGAWKTAAFKPYNFAATGKAAGCGALHPLLKVRSQFREIFLELGFEEMPTNNFVESSFWNFDALFQPQQHPARDAHDTFFLSDPADAREIPAEYMERVKAVHENGGHGSLGYRYNWKEVEARKNILRTHTTAVSSRVLEGLARQYKETGKFEAHKYFSIDRVFRNEMMDATHLCEFHQVEGMVVDRGLTLGHLMGIIKAFFAKIGIEDVRFKPAYNPYTEPSMEIFGFHPQLKRWVEIGNSGVFRPEMLLPMGLPDDVRVVAWGLSLERPTMILYGIDNIRDLIGHKMDIGSIVANPICRIHQ